MARLTHILMGHGNDMNEIGWCVTCKEHFVCVYCGKRGRFKEELVCYGCGQASRGFGLVNELRDKLNSFGRVALEEERNPGEWHLWTCEAGYIDGVRESCEDDCAETAALLARAGVKEIKRIWKGA